MNVLMSNIPQQSIIDWRAGTPIKYGCYLVLCVHGGNLVIHHDVWFDDGRGWQSKWHNMIAWCAFEDIILKEES